MTYRQRPHELRGYFVVGLVFAIHGVLLLLLFPYLGSESGVLVVLPAIAAGWLLGTRAGLVAGLLGFLLNLLLLNAISAPGLAFKGPGLAGSAMGLLAGFVAGQLHDARQRLTQERDQQRLAQAALQASEPPASPVEMDRQSYAWFLANMDQVNRAIQGTNDLTQVMIDVLDLLLSIFNCDRAWLVYPCDPDAATWQVPMERTRPEYPSVLPVGVELPLDPAGAAVFRTVRDSPGPVQFGLESGHRVPIEMAQEFGFQSFIAMAFYPKIGAPWSFGLHQCSFPRIWTAEEESLFQAIGGRLSDALTGLLMYRNLQESELRYRELFENTSDVIVISEVTKDGRLKLLDVNPAWEAMIGQPRAVWIGRYMDELSTHEIPRQILEQALICLEKNTPVDYEHDLVTATEHLHLHITLIPVSSAAGGIYRLVVVGRDISERKKAEDELQHSNDLLRAIIEAAPTAIIGLDLDGNVHSVWNPAAEKMLGWSAEEAIGHPLPSVSEERQAEFTGFRDRIRRGETLDGVEAHRQKRDGTPIDYSIYASPLHDAQGHITGNVAVLLDITERKRVHSIMQARLRLLEFASAHSMDEFLTATLDEIEALTGSTIGFYHFLESNQDTLSLQSWSTNTLAHMCTAEGKGSHYAVAQAGVWVDCIHERRPVIHNDYASLPHRKGLPEGHAPVIRQAVVPIFRGNLIKAIIGVGNKPTPYDETDIEIISQLGDLSWDIAGRKLTEEALKEQYSTLRSISDSANALIFSIDRQYRYTSFNQEHAAAMKAIYGVDIEIGHNLLDYMSVAEDREAAKTNLDRTLAGEELVEEAYSGEELLSRRYYQISHSPIKSEHGEIIGVAMLAQDMSERKRTELEIARMNRALRMLSDTNQAVIHMTDETALLSEICRIAVEAGGYRMAWVAFVDQDAARTIRPVAHAGFEQGYLDSLDLTWADSGHGLGPVRTAIRTGQPCLVRDLPGDPAIQRWSDKALERGYRSAIALPLISETQVLGALCIYATESDAFDSAETEVLTELADDLAFGIASLRTRVRRDQAVEALRRNEEKLSDVFTTIEEALLLNELIHDERGEIVDYRILEVNPAFEKDTGLSRDQVIGRRISELLELLGMSPGYINTLWNTHRHGEQVITTDIFIEQKKEWKHVIVSRPVQDRVVISYSDITERMKFEEALRESEKQLAKAQQIAHIGHWDYEIDADRITGSEEIFRILGLPPQERTLNLARFLDLVHPEDRPLLADAFAMALRGGPRYEGDYRVVRPTGEVRFHHNQWTVTTTESGQPSRLFGTVQDITERKRAEEDLRKLSHAIEQSPASIIITDTTGRIEYVNPKLTEISGYTRDEVIGQNPRMFRSGETPPEGYKQLWDTITHGSVWRGEFHNKKKNGDLYWELASISPVLDEQGHIQHFVAIKEDITERKRRERDLETLVTVATALRAAAARDEVLRVVVDQVFNLLQTGGVALMLRDPENRELVAEIGRGEWEHAAGFRLPLDAGISGRVVSTGQPYFRSNVRTDELLYRPDMLGGLHAVACIPLIAEDEVTGVVWVGRQAPIEAHDVRLLKAIADMAATAIRRTTLYEQTQRHAVELEERVIARTRELAEANARLLELDHLKTRFVSDVSHELRTPITNLKLHLGLLQHGKAEKREHYMTVLEQQTGRLAQLVESILDLSRLELRAGRVSFAPVDLNQIVETIVTTHQPAAENANLSLVFEPAPDLPPVKGEMNQLAQVVTNLVANAINYTPVGRIRVCTSLENDRVCLTVEDTGLGIAPEDIPHLFERFYRGTQVSQGNIPGTGLGLAIVKEIVDIHEGSIEVASQPGQGSRFTVRLPIAG